MVAVSSHEWDSEVLQLPYRYKVDTLTVALVVQSVTIVAVQFGLLVQWEWWQTLQWLY